MSEENKVTAVEKSEKAKDPRKVELGKRLAKISREAKEREARQRSKSENKQSYRLEKEITDLIDFRYLIGGVTIVTALGGLYYAYKRDKREIKLLENPETKQKEKNAGDRPKVSAPKVQRQSCKLKDSKDLKATKVVFRGVLLKICKMARHYFIKKFFLYK